MKIRILNRKEDERRWDQYVLNNPNGNFYQLSGWKKIYEDVFGFSGKYYFVEDNGQIIGVMPLFLMRNILRKRFLVSIPFSSYAGVCFDSPIAGQVLLAKAKELARKYKVQYVEFRQFKQIFGELPQKTKYVTMMTKLEKNYQDLWNHTFKPKLRSVIRQGKKNGLIADWGQEYLDEFYKVFCANMKRLGTPVHPERLFAKIMEVFGDKINIGIVRHGKRVIAGMFTVEFNRKIFSDPWASSLWEFNHLRPNNVLYWSAIKRASNRGFAWFDFGRSTIGSGTYLFKKHWGAKPIQLLYEYFLLHQKVIPEVDPENNKYGVLIDIWKKLPLSLASSFGQRIVKYLPEL